MAELTRESFWESVRAGKPGAIVGTSRAVLPPGWTPDVVRVSGDRSPFDVSPLVEARRTIDRLVGVADEKDGGSVFVELRRRLLGDVPESQPGDAFVDAANRLARSSRRGALLVLDAADAADEATLSFFEKQVGAEDGRRLEMPFVVALSGGSSTESANRLLAAIRDAGGVVFELSEPSPEEATPDGSDAPVEQRGELEARLRALPASVRDVLRVAALAGEEFSAVLVATVLGVEIVDVLDSLQQAVDAGIPIEDDGDLHLRLHPLAAHWLRGTTLPSFRRVLLDALRDALPDENAETQEMSPPAERQPARQEKRQAVVEDAKPNETADAGAPTEPARSPVVEPPLGREPVEEPTLESPVQTKPERPRLIPIVDKEKGAEKIYEKVDAPVSRRGGRMGRPIGLDSEIGAAMEAIAEAERIGAYADAMRIARRALAQVRSVPPTEQRRLQTIELLCQVARLHWVGSGPGFEFSLAAALEVLDDARAFVSESDPPEIRVQLARLIANVCYELGDVRALERALDELSHASRVLMEAGRPYDAARLLNDQAAVYVRAGDPVRAAHLLEESRKVFAERADTDPIALTELAETDHLLARIPLNVAARPGKEEEALTSALDHARRAAGAFKRLGIRRELHRVWETMGRLESARGNQQEALSWLARAADGQQSDGDAMGLAKTAAAMADVLGELGRRTESLALLRESIRLNMAKGSPLGLAFNRRTFERLASSPKAMDPPGALRRVAADLARAEATIGRVPLNDVAD